MNTQTNTRPLSSTLGLVRVAIVAALYVAITLAIAPFAFGPIQLRISEMFNFLALYNKRYIWAVTIGVAIANFIGSTPVDVVVGSLQTLIFLFLGRILTKKLAGRRVNLGKLSLNLQFLVFNVIFTLSMIVIAVMLYFMYQAPLFITFLTVTLGEFIVLFFGGIVVEELGKRVDLHR